MAAGRIDVSRRRADNSYSGRSGASVVQLDRGGLYKNGHRASSGGQRLYSTDEKRRLVELQSGSNINGSPRLEDGEIPKCEGEFPLPVGKKRKFSPVTWDVEKKAAVKNGVVEAITTRSSHSPTVELNDALDVGVAKYSLLAEQFADLDSTRSVSMSRWASESDSPSDACLSDDDGTPDATTHGRDFSFERVRPPREVLNGDKSRFSGSIERDSGTGSSGVEDFGNDVHMDVDDDDDDQVSDYCDEVEGSAAASGGSVDMLQGCRSVHEYERLNEISEGTYGKVYKARDKKTGQVVALKKMKMDVGGYRNLEDYGFPLTSLREINILLSFRHPSIVNVKEVVMGGLDDIFMVMEYMEHDLKGLMKLMKQPFSTSEVKCLMLQLLGGVKYLHDNWVLHRDLKTSNLLLNNEGGLKICDFGMSRLYGSPLKSYTSLVVTLWYRAPELLLGAKQYSTAVDMWSVGCIMAEMLAKEPLFTGKNEVDQLSKIFKVLGTPSEAIWPGYSKLPGSKANFVMQPYNLLRKKFPASSFTGSSVLSDMGFDLLNKLLTYDPEKRLTVDDALNHPWFDEVPLPKSKAFMPTFPPQYAGNRIMFKTQISSLTHYNNISFLVMMVVSQ